MLFAYLPDDAFDRTDLVQQFLHLADVGYLPKGATMTPGHKDGWGTAYYKNAALCDWYRGALSATSDEYRHKVIEDIEKQKADSLLIHVRKVTIGEPSERNSHPFMSGRFSFVHNGTLGKTDQSIFDPVRGRTTGETDSEYYFHLVIDELSAEEEHAKERVSEEITKTVRALRVGTSYQGGGFTSASSLLTDGRYAYVLREFDEGHPFVQKFNAHDYYTLFLGLGEHGERIVCSEQILLSGVTWTLLPNHSLTVIDLVSGDYETRLI